uniref:Uncharacterized protein n=1 Tax=Arundo donax TaxID=35708 RepID=A0A0A9HGV7_ARUDO
MGYWGRTRCASCRRTASSPASTRTGS